MRVILNGEDRQVPVGMTVSDLLALEREPAGHVLVEINGEFVPPRHRGARVLADGDRIEIIHPAFGG